MDRSLTAALFRPRHLVVSALLFLALGGGGGLLVGFAQAASEDGDRPSNAVAVSTFTLAVPVAGDRGTYEIVPAEGATLDEAMEHESFRRLDFDMLGAQIVRNEAGEAEWANLVRLNETEFRHYSDGSTEMATDDEVYAARPGTEDAFAYIRVRNEVAVDEDVTRRDVSVSIHFQERPRTLPTGFANVLHGQPTEVPARGLPVAESCDVCGGPRPNSRQVLEAVSAAEVDGVRYLRAEIVDYHDGGLRTTRIPEVELLYREDVPYPLLIHEVGRPSSRSLTGFERGTDTALLRMRDVVAGPPAALTFAPLNPWGPDDGGVERPFMPRQAYELARDDAQFTALRDFLAAHPGAYLGELRGRATIDDRDGDRHSWTFTVTDGQQLIDIDVEATGASGPAAALPPVANPLPLPQMFGAPVVELEASEIRDARGRYPLPEAVRDRPVPTVASMLDQWRVYASPLYAEKASDGPDSIAWMVSLECTYDWDTRAEDCSRSTVRAGAGYHLYNRTYPDQPVAIVNPANPIDSNEQSYLHWIDLPGRPDLTYDAPSYYSDSRTDWRRDGQVPALASAPDMPADASSRAVPLAVAGVWVFPDAEAATAIGLGATLISLLFWLKPLLKGGFVGLFSRVRNDELLDDPTRALLVSAVEAQPGIHHQALVRLAGKGNGATEHHLQKLVVGGLLSRHRSDGYTCYFRTGKVDHRTAATAHLLKSPVARAVLDIAVTRPGASLADVARAQGVSVPTVHYHAKRLREAGLVRFEGGLQPGPSASLALGGPTASAA